MGKKSPKPPPAPDYAGAAQQQGIANLEAARLTARLSNPNVITPLGGQRVTYGRPQFNRAAYDAAMANYRARNPQAPATGAPQGAPSTVGVGGGAAMPTTGGGGVQMGGGGMYGGGVDLGVTPEPTASKADGMPAARREALGMGDDLAYTQGGRANFTTLPTGAQVPTAMLIGGGRFDASGMGPGQTQRFNQGYGGGEYLGDVMPTREMFTEMVDLDTPTIEQYLTPEAQATLEAQQRVERALSGLGERAIGRVQDVYGTAFTPQGLPEQQFQFQGGGPLPTLPQLQGQARSDVSALPVNFGPTAGQYGTAGAGPQGLNLGGFDASRVGGIAAAPAGGQFGAATGGPAAGQFGMAQGGPGALNLQGLDTGGLAGVQTGVGQFGQAQGGPAAPTLQGQLDVSNLAQMPVNAGMTAQEAIMSRLDPQLQRQRSQLETQLANQGLVRGGEAYNVALQEQGQRENDLRTQAALQGLQLDMQARQQGLGEAQALGGFANQSALAGFGAGQQATQAQNAAIAQNASLALQSGQFANQAQAQQFAQRLAAGEFGREAQLASFQTGQAAQDAVNRAISQNFGQAQAAGQMGNQAIGQNFQQALASQQAALQAQQQGFGQQMAGQQFGRESALQGFQSQQAAQEAANRAIAQNFGQGLAAQGAYNAAAGQQFGQEMDIAGLYNASLAQNQAAALQQAQAQAALQSQGFNQAQAMANFQNAQRQAALQEQLALRQLPLNEVAAIMGGAQVQLPQFQAYQGAEVGAAPIFGATQAAGNFAQQNYSNQIARQNAQMGLYGQLGGALGTYLGGRK
jgi:hypothetical protein